MQDIYISGESLLKEIESTNVIQDSVAFWSLGQSGIIIKGLKDNGMICIDPYLTNSIQDSNPRTEFVRAFEPVLSPNMLKNVAGVIATHEHDDHLDRQTIRGIADVTSEMTYMVPAPHVSLLEKVGISKDNIISAVAGEVYCIEGFKITPIPAAHTEYEQDEHGNHISLGYFIEVNGVRLYHSGDTIITPSLIEKVKEFNPHVAFLPINGGDYFRTSRGIIGNMTFREAADFAVHVGVDLIVPVHFDLFPNNRDNPAYFVDYLFHHYPRQKFHMMVAGERFIYHK